MTVSAVRPWRTALQRERSLPSSVVGPVLLRALPRLASICLSELMGYSTHKIGFVSLVASTLQSGFAVPLLSQSLSCPVPDLAVRTNRERSCLLFNCHSRFWPKQMAAQAQLP